MNHCRNYLCGLESGCVCKCDSCVKFDFATIKAELEELKKQLQSDHCDKCGRSWNQPQFIVVPYNPFPVELVPYQFVYPNVPYPSYPQPYIGDPIWIGSPTWTWTATTGGDLTLINGGGASIDFSRSGDITINTNYCALN